MEFSLEIGVVEEIPVVEEDVSVSYEICSERSLIPKAGLFLGLDISERSSGVCIYEDGEKVSANISLITPDDVDYSEVKLRRELKENLRELIKGKQFDLIVVEDAFQGINPKTTRKLYALNTAIDEMILDGECGCKEFKRVSNQTWKSWLYQIDSEGKYKLVNDKLRIQKCLEMLGVYDEGEGYQDRLDSCGMLLGYFLCKDSIKEKEKQKSKKRVEFQDVCVNYEEDIDLAVLPAKDYNEDIETVLVNEKRWSKSKILNYLTENPKVVYVTEYMERLGNLASMLELPYLEDGGYFAFWVKGNKVKKYLKEE